MVAINVLDNVTINEIINNELYDKYKNIKLFCVTQIIGAYFHLVSLDFLHNDHLVNLHFLLNCYHLSFDDCKLTKKKYN